MIALMQDSEEGRQPREQGDQRAAPRAGFTARCTNLARRSRRDGVALTWRVGRLLRRDGALLIPSVDALAAAADGVAGQRGHPGFG